MPLSYLLDTNIISDLVRRPGGTVATRITEVGEDSICTSIVVAAELRYGAVKSDSKQLSERVDLFVNDRPNGATHDRVKEATQTGHFQGLEQG